MDEKLLQFEAAYGNLVWTRVTPKFSWWPAYIYNPTQLPENLKITASKHCGKKHAIYYYGMTSNCYGFALPNQTKDYATCREEFIKQTIKKKEREIFDNGVNLADSDLSKPVEERLAWNHKKLNEPELDEEVDNNNTDNDNIEKIKVEKIKVKLKSRNITSNKTMEEKIKDKIISNKKEEENKDDEDDEDDDSVLSSDDENDNYSSSGENEKKRKKIIKKKEILPKNKKIKVSNDKKNTVKESVKVKRILPDRDNNIYQSDIKKMKDAKLKEKSIESIAAKERLEKMKLSNIPVWQQMLSINSTSSIDSSSDISQSNNILKQKIDLSSSSSSSSSSEREIKIRNLVDFLTTLSSQTQTMKSDNSKALEILKRIDKMSLTISEIQSFEVGKLVSSLRKHSDPIIAATSKTLRSKFIDLLTNVNKNNNNNNNQVRSIKSSTPSSSSSSSNLEKNSVDKSITKSRSNAKSIIDIYEIKKSDSKKDLIISNPIEAVKNVPPPPVPPISLILPPAPPKPPLIEADLLANDNFNEGNVNIFIIFIKLLNYLIIIFIILIITIDLLSIEVRGSVARIRASRMLHTTLRSTIASNRMERAVYNNYNLNNSITDKYLFIISKLTFSLQDSTLYKLRKRILAIENPSDNFLTLVVKDKVTDLQSIFV
jgi:hypothetical protein